MSDRSLDRTTRAAAVRTLLITAAVGTAVAVVVAGVVAAGGSASDGNGDSFGFENESYEVEPPEAAEIGLNVPDGGVFSVLVDAPGDQFSVEVTAGYSPGESGGRNPTLRLDAGNASSDDPSDYLSVSNARVHRITIHEHDVDEGGLPGGQYELRAIRGRDRSVATLDVSPSVSLTFEQDLNQTNAVRDPVRTITGETGLQPGEQLEIRVTSTGQDAFQISTSTVVADDSTFGATVDLSPVPAGARFQVTAHHDGLTRARREVRLLGDLPEPVDGRQVSSGVTFAYGGDQLVLEAAPDQTITGETRLEEGNVVTILLRSPESHLYVTTTEVDSYGIFNVTADLGGLQPRRDVVVSAIGDRDARGAAPAVIVPPDRGDGDSRQDTAANVLLDESGSGDGAGGSDGGPRLATGVLAIALGLVLTVVASGLLLGLGVGRSTALSQRE